MLSRVFELDLQFFAQKKGGGTASTNRSHDSISKRLGVKKFGGEFIKSGSIIVRQRGTKFHGGEGTFMGRDHTIHAKIQGFVHFSKDRRNRTLIEVVLSR